MKKQIKKQHKYGWRPQIPDIRDFKYKISIPVENLPKSIDLRKGFPEPYNQGNIGSCTANAIAAIIEFEQIKEINQNKGKNTDSFVPFVPSRLFIYFNERVMENTVKSDAGAVIRDGIKSVNVQGVCKETTWPYIEKKFATKPTDECYKEALNYQALVYSAVGQDPNSVKACLANGDPIVFGMSIYESFESQDVADTGIVPMPNNQEQCLGGHAVVACGYDDDKKQIIVRNSWGKDWGDGGYFFLPYEYFFSQLTSDFWSIKKVEI